MISTNTGRRPVRRLGRLGTVAASAIALAALAGCSSGTSQGAASTSSATNLPPAATLVIATPTPTGTPAGVPLWIGEKNGYFAKENLTVKIVAFPGQPANAVAAVVGKQADLVVTAPDALIVPTANQGPQNLKWIFTPYQSPTFAMGVLENSRIKTAADLAGKTVAMPSTGAPFQTFMNANIKDEGADPTTVKVVAVPGATAVAQLSQGAVDALVMQPSDIAQAAAVTGVKIRTLPLAPAVAKDFGAGFVMRADSTAAQKDAYARYLRAYLESVYFARSNPQAALDINYQMYPASKPANDTAAKANLASLKAFLNLMAPAEGGKWGYIAPERWNAHISGLGLSSKIPDSSVLYDNSMLSTISDFNTDAVKADASNYGK